MHEMKLCVQALRPALMSGRMEPCHWSEGRQYQCWGVTAGNASHNASNARGVTAGKMGRNSSDYSVTVLTGILSACLSLICTTSFFLVTGKK